MSIIIVHSSVSIIRVNQYEHYDHLELWSWLVGIGVMIICSINFIWKVLKQY